MLLDEDNVGSGTTQSGYSFSHVGLDRLQSPSYVVVNFCRDISGSTRRYSRDLEEMIKEAVRKLKKSPVQDTILFRVVDFNGSFHEVHGFTPIPSINEDQYPSIDSDGSTRLYDVCVEGLESLGSIGSTLHDQDYDTTLILVVGTDGEDVGSTKSPQAIKQLKENLLASEKYQQIITILAGVGITEPRVKKNLEALNKDGGFDHFKLWDAATPDVFNGIVDIVVSVSVSASQSLTSGVVSTPTF